MVGLLPPVNIAQTVVEAEQMTEEGLAMLIFDSTSHHLLQMKMRYGQLCKVNDPTFERFVSNSNCVTNFVIQQKQTEWRDNGESSEQSVQAGSTGSRIERCMHRQKWWMRK